MRISALCREANLFVKEQIRVGTALACILRKLIETDSTLFPGSSKTAEKTWRSTPKRSTRHKTILKQA